MNLRSILISLAVLIVLGGLYFMFGRAESDSEPAEEPIQRVAMWNVDMLELERISIQLLTTGQSESWVKREDKYWYFDRPDGPRVAQARWGGGIPLILSGPNANRLITRDATEDQLRSYGLVSPRMTIMLEAEDGETVNVQVGEQSLAEDSYYIKLKDGTDVYSVDYTWYDVLERLVTDQPT